MGNGNEIYVHVERLFFKNFPLKKFMFMLVVYEITVGN